jgi:hypothetical protein
MAVARWGARAIGSRGEATARSIGRGRLRPRVRAERRAGLNPKPHRKCRSPNATQRARIGGYGFDSTPSWSLAYLTPLRRGWSAV